MINEFKKFVLKGNVLDMAIGVIIGTALGKVVTSLVSDVLMPPIGLILGKVNFSNLFINLGNQPIDNLAAAKAAGLPTINYGLFINTVVDFLITSFIIFIVIRQIEHLHLKRSSDPLPPTAKDCPYCCSAVPFGAVKCPHCTADIN